MSKENTNIRFIPFFIFVFIAGALILARLFQVQVLLHKPYAEIAERQHVNRIPLELPRGKIYDRRGTVLGLTIPRSYSYGVHPRNVRDHRTIAANLAKVSGKPVSYFNRRMNSNSNFVWLLRQQDVETAEVLADIPDLVIQAEARRYYPLGNHTPKVVGFTNRDCKGVAGLEMLYDSTLTSKKGWEFVLEDARGNQAVNSVNPGIAPVPGADLILTFDNVIQNLVSRELEEAIDFWDARGGYAIVMLPRTGEILGMASYPPCDPNHPDQASLDAQRIRNVVDAYEPGSTFKIVPMLAALKKGIPLNRKIDCNNGSIKIGTHWIHDVHRYKILTAAEVLINSSNIGIGKIAALAGDKLLYETARDLGFGTYTGIEIPGESRGNIPSPADWDEYLRATIGMGQGISCSGIQLTAAYSAIAAGGILLQPRVIRDVLTPQGGSSNTEPQVVRRAASKDDADALTEILVRAVESGTGKAAQINGLTIAGKTGTAQKYDRELQKYSDDQFIASFIGYTVDEPRVLCFIAIDEPQRDHYGGIVAAPVFKKIMEKAVPVAASEQREHFGPSRRPQRIDKNQIVIEDFINITIERASAHLQKKRIPFNINGGGKTVFSQFPLPGSYFTVRDTVELYTIDPQDLASELKGLNTRQAVKKVLAAGYSVKIQGSGIVQRAEFKNNRCTLFCSPNKNTETMKLTACVSEKY